jgi:hypothetical protein
MNDLIKIISVVAVCILAGFFLLKNNGQPNTLNTSNVLARSENSSFPRIGNYIPDSWKGESMKENVFLADNTVTKDTERISLAELQESSKNIAIKEVKENKILTASVVNAGSYGVGAQANNGVIWLVVVLMIAILIILSRLISMKKRVMQSRQSFFFPETDQPYGYR